MIGTPPSGDRPSKTMGRISPSMMWKTSFSKGIGTRCSAYIEEAPLVAKEYIERMLASPFETIKRITIYAIDQHYQTSKRTRRAGAL